MFIKAYNFFMRKGTTFHVVLNTSLGQEIKKNTFRGYPLLKFFLYGFINIYIFAELYLNNRNGEYLINNILNK